MIPLFKPFVPKLPYLQEIMQSGQLAYGDYTKQFEKELKEYFGTENLMVVNTFFSAIAIVSKTLGLKPKDEVIMSPMGCLVSTQPYASLDLSIKWCDVDKMTGTIDPEYLQRCISSKTKIIVNNHFCGYPGYIDEVNSIAKKHGLIVIDDGIEGFGSKYKGKKLGVCGTDITIFSLSAVRTLNTVEGGVIIFKDKNLYEKALLIRDCGIDRGKFRDALGEIRLDCDIKEVGYSAMMSNVNGYIGLEQLKYVDILLERQKKRAQIWDDFFVDSSNKCKFIDKKDNSPNYWIYGVLAEDKKCFIKQFREKGFYASGVHVNNNIYTVFGKSEALRGAKEFNEHFVALPCGWWMENDIIV